METEFEAKFYPVNKEEYRQKLLAIGAKLTIPERKMKRVLADKSVNPQIKSTNIRVRDEGNVIRLSAKIDGTVGGAVSDQKEADIVVPDFNKTKEILEYAGIKFHRYQENLREEWEYKGAQITIDTWPGLSTYSEIEGESEEAIHEIANELGFDWDKKITASAADVYSRVYELDIKIVLEMINYITFEKNPFANLPKVWDPKTQWE